LLLEIHRRFNRRVALSTLPGGGLAPLFGSPLHQQAETTMGYFAYAETG
jgi:hypothetical protein